LLLRLAPGQAFINDSNEELTNSYIQVRDNFDDLIKYLEAHQNKDSKEYYLKVRSYDRDGSILKMSDVERAARFIYLNKAGYNGLWRVNSKGQNNVPYGSHKTLNLIGSSLRADGKYFKIHSVKAMRFINSKSSGRGKVGELVITNY